MASGVLSFADFLGGPDNINLIQVFPSDQRIYTYDFGTDATNFKYALDYQTLVVDPISFGRDGTPNFTNSETIGYFPKVDLHGVAGGFAVAGADFVPAQTAGQASAGTYVKLVAGNTNKVQVLYPAAMYIGPIVPDARSKVCLTVVSFSWANGTVTDKSENSSFRFGFLQCYEPDAPIGDPTGAAGFTAITVS